MSGGVGGQHVNRYTPVLCLICFLSKLVSHIRFELMASKGKYSHLFYIFVFITISTKRNKPLYHEPDIFFSMCF